MSSWHRSGLGVLHQPLTGRGHFGQAHRLTECSRSAARKLGHLLACQSNTQARQYFRTAPCRMSPPTAANVASSLHVIILFAHGGFYQSLLGTCHLSENTQLHFRRAIITERSQQTEARSIAELSKGTHKIKWHVPYVQTKGPFKRLPHVRKVKLKERQPTASTSCPA